MLSFSKLPAPGVLWALSAPLNAGQGRSDPRATALVPPPAPGAPPEVTPGPFPAPKGDDSVPPPGAATLGGA